MNCQSFEAIVSEIAREQMIDVSVRSEALGHSVECAHCGQRLEAERAITGGLGSLAVAFSSHEAPARVETNLLAAFDQRAFVETQPVSRSRSRYWIAAIAAVLLVLIGVSIARWRQSESTNQATGDRVVTNVNPAFVSPVNTVPVPVAKGNDGEPANLPRPSFRPRHRPAAPAQPAVANPANSEIATDFLPVTYGGAANLTEGGRMFRVELPRSAMATFGLPVNMDRANERVKADVLVGVDGLAHAIRFVR